VSNFTIQRERRQLAERVKAKELDVFALPRKDRYCLMMMHLTNGGGWNPIEASKSCLNRLSMSDMARLKPNQDYKLWITTSLGDGVCKRMLESLNPTESKGEE